MTKLAYVTSFNKRIYEASGAKLLKSFYNTKSEGDLFCYTEELDVVTIDKDITEKTINLDESPDLQTWLQNNRDIIPENEGGLLKPCKCKNPWSLKEREHLPNCNHIWFKRCAYRWFKKVYSLRHFIATQKEYTYLIWIDADCVFLRQIKTDEWKRLFDWHSVLYLKGQREIEECGVVGYNLEKEGKDFICDFYNAYIDNTFRRLKRWDDSYVFHWLREERYKFVSQDLANKKGDHAEVISGSMIGDMLAHEKGKHGPRILGLFK